MKVRDKKTGRVISFDWRGATRPTKDQIDQIRQQQESSTVDFSDVKGGVSTSPLSVSNPEPEPVVQAPTEKSFLGKAYDFVKPAVAPMGEYFPKLREEGEAYGRNIQAGADRLGLGGINRLIQSVNPNPLTQFSENMTPIDIATLPLTAASGAVKAGSIIPKAAKTLEAAELGIGALGLSQGEDKLANSLRVSLPVVGSLIRKLAPAAQAVDDIAPPKIDPLEVADPVSSLSVNAPSVNAAIPEITDIGADFGPDYVNEVLKAGKRAQKGVEATPGINVVKQGDADVVNFYDNDGTLLASGQVKNGKITDIAKITKRFTPEELAGMPPELRENATRAAREVRSKLHELGGVSDPGHRSADATRAQEFYIKQKLDELDEQIELAHADDSIRSVERQTIIQQLTEQRNKLLSPDQLSVEDPDLALLQKITQERGLPIDPTKLDPESRSGLLRSLGERPSLPPTTNPVGTAAKERAKPKQLFNFPEWVNRRRASKIEGQLKGRDFADLDEAGQQAIFDIQAGANTNPRYQDVRKYLDEKFAEVKKSGSGVQYQENYLPQLWENKPEEVTKVFQQRLGKKSTFEFSKVIKDYQEGIEKGLTPKFNKVSELVDWYERTANKNIADRGFFNMLRNLKQVSTRPKPGWVAADPNVFPTLLKGKKNYYMPKEVADLVNNYLREPEGKLADVAKFAGHAKNWVLSSGIPGTGINMQGVKTLIGSTLASKNPFKGFAQTAAHLVNPKWAKRELEGNLKDAPRFMRAGMKFSAEDFGLPGTGKRTLGERLTAVKEGEGNIFKKTGKAIHEVHSQFFEDPMYQGILPATKLRHAKLIEADLLKKGIDPEEATTTAAHAANEIFGGINFDELGRSKEFQNILRSTVLAPDHYESQIRLGKNMLRGLKGDKKDLIYRRMTRNLLGAYISASVANKISSGKWMHENPDGKKFSVYLGTTSGKKERYLRPFGTMTDFARVPYDIVESLAKGDIGKSFDTVANRASVPVSAGMHILSNRDYRGRELYGPKVDLPDELLNVGTEIGNVFVPSYGQATGDYLTGKSETEEALAAGLEVPLHYRKRPKKGIGVAP